MGVGCDRFNVYAFRPDRLEFGLGNPRSWGWNIFGEVAMAFLITCEHGTSQIPEWLEGRLDRGDGQSADSTISGADSMDSAPGTLRADQALLADEGGEPDHLWVDSGALDAAKLLAKHLRCPSIVAPYSKRVIDVNRSLHARGLFSCMTRRLPEPIRTRMVDEIHRPYRDRVRSTIDSLLKNDDLVVHLSVHSFSPFPRDAQEVTGDDRIGTARRTDIGLLYDPSRLLERDLCLDWYEALYWSLPMLRVRRNYPRRGTSDSLTRSLRETYDPSVYLGIQLQLNQAWCTRQLPIRRKVFKGLAETLTRVCSGGETDGITAVVA